MCVLSISPEACPRLGGCSAVLASLIIPRFLSVAGITSKEIAPVCTVISRQLSAVARRRGLTLTLPQAARLLGVNVGQSERLLSELIDRGFLMRDIKGAYRRR